MLALLSAAEAQAAGERAPWRHGTLARYVGISGHEFSVLLCFVFMHVCAFACLLICAYFFMYGYMKLRVNTWSLGANVAKSMFVACVFFRVFVWDACGD
jgi:hypothetical protein